MTRANRMLVGAAIGAMVGIILIALNGAGPYAQSAVGNIAGLIANVLPSALIGAVIALCVKPKQKATPQELDRQRDNWSDEEKETFRNLMNKGDLRNALRSLRCPTTGPTKKPTTRFTPTERTGVPRKLCKGQGELTSTSA